MRRLTNSALLFTTIAGLAIFACREPSLPPDSHAWIGCEELSRLSWPDASASVRARFIPACRMGQTLVEGEIDFAALDSELARSDAAIQVARARTNEGVDWELGRGGRALDRKMAASSYGEGCVLGDGLGCANFGRAHADCVEGSNGGERTALALYRLGCASGSSYACAYWAMAQGAGLAGITPDPRLEVQLYRWACDHGEAFACTNLGVKLELAAAQDRVLTDEKWGSPLSAISAYHRACDAGSELGCQNLDRISKKTEEN